MSDFPKWQTLLIVLMIAFVGFSVVMFLPDITGVVTEIGDTAIRFLMGALGAIIFIVSLVYGAEKVKAGEYIHAFVYTFLGVLFGAMFILVWLYG
jgi:hypothetical protein